MKTKEELSALKEEVETVSKKLHALSEEELEQVTGGTEGWGYAPGNPCPYCGTPLVYGGVDEFVNVNYSLCPNENCPQNVRWLDERGKYAGPWKLYY